MPELVPYGGGDLVGAGLDLAERVLGSLSYHDARRYWDQSVDTAQRWVDGYRDFRSWWRRLVDRAEDEGTWPFSQVEDTQRYNQTQNKEMIIAGDACAPGGSYFGSNLHNGYKKSKWGKITAKKGGRNFQRFLNSTVLSTVYRWQSVSKYDNGGLSSLPLWVTAEYASPNVSTQLTNEVSGAAVKSVSDYETLWLPFYCYNLTTLPQGVVTGQGGVANVPMYQLGKKATPGFTGGVYIWRTVFGMNNARPSVNPSGGLVFAGSAAVNPITNSSCVAHVEYTNQNLQDISQHQNVGWEHVYSNVKLLISSATTRSVTYRTGVISFTEEDAAPIRQFSKSGSETTTTAYDVNTTDYDINRSITAFWDQYWNTKANHPLLTVRRMESKKPLRFHKFEKFTIGNIDGDNPNFTGLQVRKDITIGSQGYYKGTKLDEYSDLISAQVFDKNIQNQTVDAFLTTQTGATTTITGNQVSLQIGTTLVPGDIGLYRKTGTPAEIAADPTKGPIASLQNGAPYPIISSDKISTIYPDRHRDKWFFIQADYFMGTNLGAGQKSQAQQLFHKDVGPPGTDACYADVASTVGFNVKPDVFPAHMAPPTFDIVVQSKFNVMRTFT